MELGMSGWLRQLAIFEGWHGAGHERVAQTVGDLRGLA
jgi:hypothetical protein